MDRKCIQASGVYLLVFVVSAVLLYIQLIGPLQRVQSEQYIYQEFQSDFYHGTVRPIIFRSIYNSDPTLTVDLVSYGLFAVYSIAFVMMVIMAIRRNFTFTGRLLFFSFIISVIIVLSLTLQNQLFNIRFVQNRMATFIAPLFVLALIGLFDEFLRHKALRVPALILIYCISALFLINTIKHVNFKWYLDWQEDASTREMMDDLCKDVASKPAGQVKMGIVWLHEPAINFYRKTWNLDWLKEVDRKGYNGDFDYFYVGNADSILNKEIFRDKKILKIYEKANTVLLKKMNTDEEIPQ